MDNSCVSHDYKLLKLLTAVIFFWFAQVRADDVQFIVKYENSLEVVYELKESGEDRVLYRLTDRTDNSWKAFKGTITGIGLPLEYAVPSNAPKRIYTWSDGSMDNNYFDFVKDGIYISMNSLDERVSYAELTPGKIEKVYLWSEAFEGEKYFLTSVQTDQSSETRITRQRDGKFVKIGSSFDSGAKITKGILTFGKEGIHRAIDLLAFDQEATFTPTGDGNVIDSNNQSVDALTFINDIFEDLDAKGDKEIPLTDGDLKIVDQIVTNLKRGQRSSVVLLGGAGTGKTTLVNAALQKFPRTWKVKVLDSSAIESGSRYSGMVAQRIKAIISASKAHPIIWFADEIHSLRGAGTHGGDSNDIFEKLKTPLADGTVKIIGTDTATEYHEKMTDPALQRRFTTIEMSPPTEEELRFKIVSWIKGHGYGEQPKEIIEHIIETGRDFNSSENEPSRSIGLLEASLANLNSKSDKLTKEIVNRTAGVLYKLDPAIRDVAVMRQRLKDLPAQLDQVIIGQDLLKEELIRFSKIALANLHDGVGPRLSAFMAGVPGVGKTELAKAYAKAMNLPYKVIEMSRYGNGRNGQDLIAEVAQQIRENAFSVIIFDEIEKAAPKVLESLLTFMSSDRFTAYEKAPGGGRDRTYDISSKNVSVIMTSNAGSNEMEKFFEKLPNDRKDVSRRQLSESVFTRQWLKKAAIAAGIPEPLIDRVGIISAAFPPTEAELRDIIGLHLKIGKAYSADRMKVKIDYLDTDEMIEFLISQAKGEKMSNRDLLVELKAFLKDRTSEVIMHADYEKTKTFSISLDPKIPNNKSVKAVLSCKEFFVK